MPTTRKKIIKTVYKDGEDSEEGTDFSDSGSEVILSDESESEQSEHADSSEEFVEELKPNSRQKATKNINRRKKKAFTKEFLSKLSKQSSNEDDEPVEHKISIKDLTEADKKLTFTLNLSESESSDEDNVTNTPSTSSNKSMVCIIPEDQPFDAYIELPEDVVEAADKSFKQFKKHENKLEETKVRIEEYNKKKTKPVKQQSVKVADLLALGETAEADVSQEILQADSDEEMEDWEEVKDLKLHQSGIQLIVDFPGAEKKKEKQIDLEMQLKRRINRVKKEYQIYMHKVHFLCWIAHGIHVNTVLNDQDIMAVALSLIPSQNCYPNNRVNIKYLEDITKWYKNLFSEKIDKSDGKFHSKAPPLKTSMINQMKKKILTSKNVLVYTFIAIMRALGIQCRLMINCVTLPLKPPSSELCSLSTKPKQEIDKSKNNKSHGKTKKSKGCSKIVKKECEEQAIAQLDGADDESTAKTRQTRKKKSNDKNEDVSPNKKVKKNGSALVENDEKIKPIRKSLSTKKELSVSEKNLRSTNKLKNKQVDSKTSPRSKETSSTNKTENRCDQNVSNISKQSKKAKDTLRQNLDIDKPLNRSQKPKKEPNIISQCKTQRTSKRISRATEKPSETKSEFFQESISNKRTTKVPLIKITTSDDVIVKVEKPSRKRTSTSSPTKDEAPSKTRSRTVSGSGRSGDDRSKYFSKTETPQAKRVSHRDLLANKIKNENKTPKCKASIKKETDRACREEAAIDSDEDFKPTKISPRPPKKLDRRIVSSDDTNSDKGTKKGVDIWCEVYVEEEEQWISIDVFKAQVHCLTEIYGRMSHPVVYVIGWDNANYIKDLTRKYVPHWNTVTRKLRAESSWIEESLRAWQPPKDRQNIEEDKQLDRMQMDAPLPKVISEYKNHPLYVLQRHLLKFEALYPPDAPPLGFVREEPVYARECVYTCRSRDTWLKEAKVVKLGEKPYKIVKARPKWDKLSNKLITDKELEIFGPWQVEDYVPPPAENGIIPRNAYGNVELFKSCMLPKGTVHLKLPNLNKVAKKLNLDCAPAMVGFDFHGGWTHPVFDGFVVCVEHEEILTEAWLKDQEEMERRELEKVEARVYGNWKKLIKRLLIRERLQDKYGFNDPSTSKTESKSKPIKGPRLLVKKK